MRRLLIIASTFLACGLICLLIVVREKSTALARAQPVTAEPEPDHEETAAKDLAAHERETQAQLERLAGMEARQRQRQLAAAKTYEARSQLQYARFSAWSSVINTNAAVFQALRQKADKSPNGTTACTICDGTGSLHFCVPCESNGQCPGCRGTGKGWQEEVCPTCLGTGKCYLCAGRGKMPCLHCDDGLISHTVPLPPSRLPIRCDAPTVEIAANDPEVAEPENTHTTEARTLPPGHVEPPPPPSQATLVLGVVLPLAAVLVLITVGYLFKQRFDSLMAKLAPADDRSKDLLVEDPSLLTFFMGLREGLNGSALAGAAEPLNGVPPQSSGAAPDLVQEFFASAPGQLANMRKVFSDITRAANEAVRQETLLEFLRQVVGLKDLARPPQLRPVWLMACALEGLLQQLTRNASETTTSVLATAAGAVDLLEALCVRGLNSNLAIEPPVKLLAVDDDAVSRLAISFALKKAFNAPDLATGGEAALALAAEHTYDVIFLDVDMPGMDGYELCTKIHQTVPNRTTPVVFVTRHSDFSYRAKSALSGGEDLIGKPFLAFEITVKALTLALRARLQNEAAVGEAAAVASEASEATAPPVPAKEPDARTAWQNGQSTTAISFHSNGGSFPALINGEERILGETFFTRAPARIEELHRRLQAARRAAGPADLQEFLGELFLGVHSLSLEAERAELRTVFRLICALEGMLKKLLQHTDLCIPSVLDTASAALQLLGELCDRPDANPDLARPPVRILLVDDDPVALRALSVSIQLVFGRPDHAESGEAALALTSEKRFDLIFLDVLMPGIDGVETCKRIHEAALNSRTPVVFVTSHDDAEARSKAAVAGGCGFIPKPVLPSQIKLTALTFLLRARLNQSKPATVLEEAVCSA